MSTPTDSEAPKRKWPLGLYGCFSYKDPRGYARWWPDFCLYSLICSNMMAGRVYTHVDSEVKMCNDLGMMGTLICLVLIPLSIYSPLAGMVCFGLLANYLRLRVVSRYNVEEHNYFCCGCLNPCLNFLHNACNYPCSLFQMKVSMDQWDEESPQVLASVVAPTSVHK